MSTKPTRTKGRACVGKTAHKTLASAQAHVERMVAAGAYRPRLVVYRCKNCGDRHVGHVMTTKRGQR